MGDGVEACSKSCPTEWGGWCPGEIVGVEPEDAGDDDERKHAPKRKRRPRGERKRVQR